MHSIIMAELLAGYELQRRRERFETFRRVRMAKTSDDPARPLVRRRHARRIEQLAS